MLKKGNVDSMIKNKQNKEYSQKQMTTENIL